MKKIHKLRFTDRSAFESLMQAHTDDARIVAVAVVGETGLIPYPLEFDDEGNPLPVTFREGYHVDVMTTGVIQEWKPYTVTGAHELAHSFGYGEVVTAEDFKG